MATATFGRRALVAIEVAIALPVSWKRLVTSKPSAVMTTRTSTTSSEVAEPVFGPFPSAHKARDPLFA